MAYTPAPPIDLAQVAANMRQFNPNLGPTAPAASSTPAPYSGTTSGYQPSSSPPAYNGTTSGYKPPQAPNPVAAPPMQTAAPKPQPAPQGTPTQAQKVPGGWMTADGQFVPVPNATATPAPPRPQEPPNYQFQPMPQTATPAPQMQQPTAAPVVDYKELARVRTAEMLQRKKTITDQQKGSLDSSFARQNQITNDNRTLQDSSFKETANPFSGKTSYDKAVIGRERTLADESANNNLLAQKSNIDQLLADYENATADEQLKIADELQRADRAYQLDLAQFNRSAFESDRGFNYGVGRDQVGDSRYADQTQYSRGRDAVADNRLADQTAYGRSRDSVADTRYDDKTKYDRGQDQITNNRNAEADRLVLRNQHIAEANALSTKYGITVNPTDDYQLMLDQVAGLPTVAQQSAAQKQETDQKTEAWKIVEMLGSVPNYLAEIIGVPAGTQTQKAKEAAMDDAYKNRTANISQQNANAATSNAATNAQNATTNANKVPTEKEKDYSKDISRISELYVTPGQYGGQAKVNNPQAMRNAIIALGMEDDMTDRYLTMYGLPINQ